MYTANQMTTSGYVSGEVKLGICIRILAIGSCYDSGVIFDTVTNDLKKFLGC